MGVRYAAQPVQHMQKALTEMNVYLHHVIDDLLSTNRYPYPPGDPRRPTRCPYPGCHAGGAL
jgi:hypothetical protein